MADVVQLLPLLPNLGALVDALDAAYLLVLFAAIAAQLVVARAVVDAGEGDVARQVALILAVETRQGWRGVEFAGLEARGLCW